MRLIKQYRIVKGLTLKQAAAKFKVKASTVQRWETGTCPPEPWRLKTLARVLEKDVNELARLAYPDVFTDPPAEKKSVASH